MNTPAGCICLTENAYEAHVKAQQAAQDHHTAILDVIAERQAEQTKEPTR